MNLVLLLALSAHSQVVVVSDGPAVAAAAPAVCANCQPAGYARVRYAYRQPQQYRPREAPRQEQAQQSERPQPVRWFAGKARRILPRNR